MISVMEKEKVEWGKGAESARAVVKMAQGYSVNWGVH